MNRTSETTEELACCSVALKDQIAVYGAYLKRLRPIEDGWADPRYIGIFSQQDIPARNRTGVRCLYHSCKYQSPSAIADTLILS